MSDTVTRDDIPVTERQEGPADSSAGIEANGLAEYLRLQGKRLDLPLDDHALLLAMHTSPAAIVAAGGSNISNSGELPLEIFPHVDLLSREETIPATQTEIDRAGLEQIFSPDPAKFIKFLPICEDGITLGSLLIKVPQTHTAQQVTDIFTDGQGLSAFLTQARAIAITYEWEILKHTFRCQSPVIVADSNRRIVSANSILCDMIGRSSRDLIGSYMEDLIYLERDAGTEIPYHPECVEVTTSVFVKPLYLFFTSNIGFTRIRTVCGDRLVLLIQDLFTDRRMGNSNVLLVQKLSSTVLVKAPPQIAMRRLLNVITLTLGCDLVCVLRKKKNNEMIVTPYSNKNIETLQANVIEAGTEEVLVPLFKNGNPVFCENVGKACAENSFFRRLMPLSKFAVLPVGEGGSSEYALLLAWSRTDMRIGPEAVPLLRIIANLVGSVLGSMELSAELEREKENLRRYSRLTAGRETRMAQIKRENTNLKQLIINLSGEGKE